VYSVKHLWFHLWQ